MTDPNSLYCSIMAWLTTGKPAATYFTAGEERVVASIVEDVTARLRDENARLLAAIRQHRDERGDDRCFQDDGRLYAVLPEGDTRPACETAVTLANCIKYIECRQTGREYISPQRRIEELETENARLRSALEPFAAFARATEDQGYADADWIVPARTGPVPTIGDCRRAQAALEGQGDG